MAKKTVHVKQILCATDFSNASLRAFDHAIQLASIYKARIQLLHVIPRIVASIMDIPITTSKWTADQEEMAKRELPKLKERAAKRGVSASTEIRLGDVDLQILKAAKESGADLLALGTHGYRGFEKWILGSVAERMLRQSPIPLLLTGAAEKRPAATTMRRILISTDFSEGTADAVQFATSLATQIGASIHLLHVIPDRRGTVDWKSLSEQIDAIQKRLEELIPPEVRRKSKVEARVQSGDPYRVILKTIEDSKPSLTILNTHGHGFINRVLVGSTAERVVRGGVGVSPMLLIPPQEKRTSRK